MNDVSIIQFIFHNAGSYRVSYLVSNYGRSQIAKDELSFVDSNDVIYEYQAHSGMILTDFSLWISLE